VFVTLYTVMAIFVLQGHLLIARHNKTAE